MFSSIEEAVRWAGGVLEVPASTEVQRDSRGVPSAKGEFCIVERTGGELDYPHDSPEMTFEMWARSSERAEQMANVAAIACKTMPPEDPHVNAVGVPRVYSYGLQDGGWHVWDVAVDWQVTLLD